MTEDELWSEYLRFKRRLEKLGIELEFGLNAPWVYLEKVNGKKVTEKYYGNHGFTAFWYPLSGGKKVEFSDRRKVFELVRSML